MKAQIFAMTQIMNNTIASTKIFFNISLRSNTTGEAIFNVELLYQLK